MAEDEPLIPEESRAKLRDCQTYLAFMESVCPAVARGLRENVGILRIDERWRYLKVLHRLILAMPCALVSELEEDPEKLYVLSETAQVLLLERALSTEAFLGVLTDPIHGLYEYLVDAARLTEELGSDEESRMCAFLAQKILQLVPLMYLSARHWGYVEGERPSDNDLPLSCRLHVHALPSGKKEQPLLRLVPRLDRGS